MKKNDFILVACFTILAVSFLLSHFSLRTTSAVDITGKSLIDSRATQQVLSLSVSICNQFSLYVGGNNGTLNFTNTCANTTLVNITGLTTGEASNVSAFFTSYPTTWSEHQPTATEAGVSFQFFELNISNRSSSEGTGSFRMEFTLAKASLGSHASSDVRLFTFQDSSWVALSTQVVDATSDPLRFAATFTHFSKFVIGTVSSSSASSGGGGAAGTAGEGEGKSQISNSKTIQDKEAFLRKVKKTLEPLPTPTKEKGKLLEVDLFIPEQELSFGEELVAEITLHSLEQIKGAELSYHIEDDHQHILFKNEEVVDIPGTLHLTKKMKITKDAEVGNYVFHVDVQYKNDRARATYPFRVVEKAHVETPLPFKHDTTIFIIIVFIFTLLIYFSYRRTRKN